MFSIYGVQHIAGKRKTVPLGTCHTQQEAEQIVDGALGFFEQAYAKDDSGTVQILRMAVFYLYPSKPIDPDDDRPPSFT